MKTTTGFDLLIGYLYNDGWWNDGISETDRKCQKCENSALERHKLKKYIFAFGRIIAKHASIVACPNCNHKVEVTGLKTNKKRVKAYSRQDQRDADMIKKFESLSQEQKEKVLKHL